MDWKKKTRLRWYYKGKKKAIMSFSMNRFYQGDWIDSMASIYR